jgi:endonuclease/exonuclease/phosphatase family metal-dependent hydrolase
MDALDAMDTDVLCLQEMNYREGGYWDALEIAAFLWSGRKDTDSEDLITESDYAKGASVNPNFKESPRQGGSFPYISQFTDGLPEKPSNFIVEGKKRAPLYTGGGVILSKYPLEMIANITFDDLDGEVVLGTKYAEQKGFIVVKITKQGQDYYILNTHTQSGGGSTQKNQIEEIKNWLAEKGTIPNEARVIVAGDWNTDLEEDGVIGSTLGGYEKYPTAGDIYYADTRREKATFWNRDITIGSEFSSRQIDWVLYSKENNYTNPKNMTAHAFPVRNVNYKYVDLSDHIGVTGTFEYNSPQTPPTSQTTTYNGQFLVTITTSEDKSSSTDNAVYIRMVGYQGKATPWTLCNIDDYDDFEQGEKNTYIINANNLIIENSKPPTIEVKLDGNNGLLISKIDVVYDGESNLSHTNSSKIWLDGDDNAYKSTAVFPLTKSGNKNYVYKLSITTNVIEYGGTDDKIEVKISGPGKYTSYLECNRQRIDDFEEGTNTTVYLVSDKNIHNPNKVTFKLNGTDGWNFGSATLTRNGKLYTTGVKNKWLDDNETKSYVLTPQ